MSGPFSQETIRRKKRFVGDLRSFMTRHDLNGRDCEQILGTYQGSVSKWLIGTATPQVMYFNDYRAKMKAYEEQSTPPLPLPTHSSIVEATKAAGMVQITLNGHGLSYSQEITIAQAATIISSIAQ